MPFVEKEISKKANQKRAMMAKWDNKYISSEDEQDDEISNYCFMAKDQSDEVTNSCFGDSMSYDELHSTLNELMDDFHKVLTNYFSLSKEKLDLDRENSCLKENNVILLK